MALLVKSTNDKKILIAGTTIELSSVYVRLEYAARPDGKNVEVATYVFIDKTQYLANNSVYCNVKTLHKTFVLPAGKAQNLQDVHEVLKIHYESENFEVEIIDL